jgi:hypothetical protein
MGLTLNANDAKKADNFLNVIRESGKYVGTITRAEKLLSKNGVEGVGFSFVGDDGATASYLDVYTIKPNGDKLRGYNLVQAVLCCARVKSASDGKITFQRWNNAERKTEFATADGYPELMNKRIGFVLQRELATNATTGADTDRVNIMAVFEASTGLMASEILESKTKAEKLDNVLKVLAANPVRDTRKTAGRSAHHGDSGPAPTGGFDDDIPF